MSNGNFFAVSQERFNEACDMGIGHGVVYLVLACGTGRSHTISKWSATAAYKYAGIQHARGRRFIAEMIEAGLMSNIGTAKLPKYELALGDTPTWMPNSVVMPLAKEDSPIFRIRQTRNAEVLRMLVQLYHHQNLGFTDGITPEIVRGDYTADKIGVHGHLEVYAVHSERTKSCNLEHPMVKWHGSHFWKRFNQLIQLGLVVEAINLYDDAIISDDGDDAEGEYVMSIAGPTAEEWNHRKTLDALEASGHASLLNEFDSSEAEYIAFVPPHIEHPHAYGIFRLRHSARTKAASTWWARVNQANRGVYRNLGLEHLLASDSQ